MSRRKGSGCFCCSSNYFAFLRWVLATVVFKMLFLFPKERCDDVSCQWFFESFLLCEKILVGSAISTFTAVDGIVVNVEIAGLTGISSSELGTLFCFE